MCGSNIYARVGVFDRDTEWSADSDWNFRALALGSPVLTWGHIHQDLYGYRDHAEQMTKRGRTLGAEVHLRQQAKYRPLIEARMRQEGSI